MRIFLFFIAFLSVSCTDYDLNRSTEGKPPVTEDTGELPDLENPDIRVSPSEIDFGFAPRDCAAPSQEITIRNVGGAPLEVSSIRIAGEAAPSFDHQGIEPVLEPGEEYVFEVEFTPTAWVNYHADLEVDSNDPNDATVGVPLAGAGGEDAVFEEIFFQDHYTEVDVLWVIDNSCSMAGAISQVESNFDVFIDQFLTLGLDYHLAVITTDMDAASESGRIQGSVITNNTANPKAEFMAAIAQGSAGSNDEKGLAAVEAALTEPLVSGDNAGFLRSSAALATIVVTDEDDFSYMNASNFASWYNGLKNDPNDVTFSAICGDSGSGCNNWNAFPDVITALPGSQYIQVAGATGGTWQSICTQNFDHALQHLSITAVGMRFAFALSGTPSDVSQIDVQINGSTVPYSGTEGWTYDASNNTILFNGNSVPDAGTTIRVNYPVSEGC